MGWFMRRLFRLGASVVLSGAAAWVVRRIREGSRSGRDVPPSWEGAGRDASGAPGGYSRGASETESGYGRDSSGTQGGYGRESRGSQSGYGSSAAGPGSIPGAARGESPESGFREEGRGEAERQEPPAL